MADIALTWSFPSSDAYWRFLTELAGAISPILRGLGPEAEARVRARIGEMAQPFRSGEGSASPALCVNVATRKPPA